MPRKSDKKLRKIPTLTFQFSDLWTVDYRLITALLIILPLLIYAQVWNFEFVWDDNIEKAQNHLKNPFVQLPSWENFWQLFAQPYFGMYIPVTYFLWGALKAFADLLSLPLNSVLHLSNVLVHIINGLLVFTILKQFVNNKWAVLLGTLFFLLHPIQVEVVAFVSEFRSLLAFVFCLSALYIYLKNQARFSYLTLFLFILAILSKPSATVLVLFILLINYFHYQFEWKNNILKVLPFALIALVFVIVASSSQSTESNIIWWQRPFAWLDSVVFYLFKLVFPYKLWVFYGFSPKFVSSQWWFYPLAFLPLGLGYWLWLKRKTSAMLVFASMLFVAGFFTTSGLVSFAFQHQSLVADRFLYFAMIGVALLIATIFSKTDKKLWQGGIIGLLLIFTLLSAFRQIPVWKTKVGFWTHNQQYEYPLKHAQENLAIHFDRQGRRFYQAGDIQQALIYFDKSIKQYPQTAKKNLANTLNSRGAAFIAQQNYEKALVDFTLAIRLDAGAPAYSNKIFILLTLKQCNKAHLVVNAAHQQRIKLPKSLLLNLQKNCPNKTL